MQLKFFSHAELEKAYAIHAPRFGLDPAERREFLQDIEIHTGLIVQTSINELSFSHFSIQEYLCAYYLIRQPNVNILVENFLPYREVVAIAVCLSSSREEYLLVLFLNIYLEEISSLDLHRAILGFLHRLVLEHPGFVRSVSAGLAFILIVSLLYNSERVGDDRWRDSVRAAATREVLLSTQDALKYFSLEPDFKASEIRLNQVIGFRKHLANFPDDLVLPSDFVELLSPGAPGASSRAQPRVLSTRPKRRN
jgi:hypothetical protein